MKGKDDTNYDERLITLLLQTIVSKIVRYFVSIIVVYQLPPFDNSADAYCAMHN